MAKNPHISDRDRARENVIARDQLLADRLRREAEELSLPVISVDARNVASIPDCIEPRVAAWLRRAP